MRRADDPVLTTLQQQIDWYDRTAKHADWMFKGIKVVQIGAAALIPFLSGAEAGGTGSFTSRSAEFSLPL